MQRRLEQVLFASRWLLAPMAFGLVGSLLILLVVFVRKGWALILMVFGQEPVPVGQAIVGMLSLVDLFLAANLVLMVVFTGYETFISPLSVGSEAARPSWLGRVAVGDLKLKLMANIVAISAIHVLEEFMELHDTSDRDLAWFVGLHFTFIISALLLAVMDRVGKAHD